jgi:transposase-like protein
MDSEGGAPLPTATAEIAGAVEPKPSPGAATARKRGRRRDTAGASTREPQQPEAPAGDDAADGSEEPASPDACECPRCGGRIRRMAARSPGAKRGFCQSPACRHVFDIAPGGRACAHCGGARMIRSGRDVAGRQMWLCRDCGKWLTAGARNRVPDAAPRPSCPRCHGTPVKNGTSAARNARLWRCGVCRFQWRDTIPQTPC